ncbi:MAG: beta-aspartyl-peptidase [Chloroflexi bacterium]|nr:beta-aspartyl-peptidase [Chloroflexota bacterium]
MRLELGTFWVKDVLFSDQTKLAHETLHINREELRALLLQDPNLEKADIEIVRPGEEARIIHVLDVIEPRCKVSGRGSVFPGFLGPAYTCGDGRTHRLAGVTVVLAAELLDRTVKTRIGEAIIDMSGPGAQWSPFSRTVNIVLALRPTGGISVEVCDSALLQAGLKAAEYLGRVAATGEPDQWDVFELGKAESSLPKVVYIRVAADDGALYGLPLGLTPTVLHPNEILDGALVNTTWRYAADRNVTLIQCNTPVVRALFDQHRKTLDFVGVVICGSPGRSQQEKERNAEYAVKLARFLGAQGAVVGWDYGGSSQVNLMMICKKCEEGGIKTALVIEELAGPQGDDQSLVFTTPEADAIVSCGNREETILLPPMKRVIGGEVLYQTEESVVTLLSSDPRGKISTRMLNLLASCNRIGFNTIAAQEF